MIVFKTGNLLAEDAEAIINTVNCVGIMGRGIALQFKKKYSDNFKAYEAACKRKEVQPGRMFIYETGTCTNPRFIINFPTKRHWRGQSRIEDIASGLKDLVRVIRENKICSIALPPLGCGLGGLNWNQVRPLIEKELSAIHEVQIVVFEPDGAPSAKEIVHNRKVPNMTPGRAALVELIYRYLSGLLDPFVTLLEVHKLMYFLQESGEDLKLRYTKAAFGPYAENLRHVLNAIEGHLISGYADGGDAPDKQLSLVPGAYEEASAFLSSHKDTRKRFDRVVDLVDGFETPFGLELLSTVHWVVKHDGIKSRVDVEKFTYAWNERKKQFSSRQIGLVIDTLVAKGWINAAFQETHA